jgi:hypothetical protein
VDQETDQRAIWRGSRRRGWKSPFAERAAVVEAAGGHPDPAQMNALRIRYSMAFADEPPR